MPLSPEVQVAGCDVELHGLVGHQALGDPGDKMYYIAAGVVDQAWIDRQTKDYVALLEAEFEEGTKYQPSKADWFEFFSLGAGDPLPVSAANGKQSGDLLDAVVARIPAAESEDTAALRIAFRASYGFGLVYDRNFRDSDFGDDPLPKSFGQIF